MKVIVTIKNKSREIQQGIYLYSLPKIPLFLIKMFAKAISQNIKKHGSIFYAADDLKEEIEIYEILNKNLQFTDNFQNTFLDLLHKIIPKMMLSSKLKICIICDNADERIYNLINKISSFSKVIYFVTDDERFYEKISKNTLDNYGIGVVLKKYSEVHGYDLGIILDSKYKDFHNTAQYIINLSDEKIDAQYVLDDLIPYSLNEKNDIPLKKCLLLEKNCENFNLSWKKSQKKLTNLKNSI